MLSKEILKSIRRIQIKTDRAVDDILAGAYHSAFKGRGMEFEDVREYEMGDDVRNIDWNVTARMSQAYIKSFREERELTVMLLVDVSSSSCFGTKKRLKKELLAEIGALLAFSAIRNNDRVGLILFTDTVEKFLPPGKGLRHVLRVIRELLVFSPQGAGTDIQEALSFLCKIQKRKGVCFVISDFMAPDCAHTFALVAKRHDLISIFTSDPKEEQLPDMGLVTFRDCETGEETIIDTSVLELREAFAREAADRREKCKKLMQRIDAGFMSIRTDEEHADVIGKYFRLREKRRV
ncbi:MAG: hypothetical protein ACI9S8_000262 [Chlamydiales bacterium]|jgi:uncharacterized protein (DUF58 family)